MIYPDFKDTFQYADTDLITGLVSPTGHLWKGSGTQPCIRSNRLTGDSPAEYNALTVYALYDKCRIGPTCYWRTGGGSAAGDMPPSANWVATTGGYAFVDVWGMPSYQYADVEFVDLTGYPSAPGIVLMSSSREDTDGLTYMTHFRFTTTALALELDNVGHSYTNAGPFALASPATIDYATYAEPVVTGRVYRLGVHYLPDGGFLFDLPGGNQYYFADDRYKRLCGRYLCFQPNASVTDMVVHEVGAIMQHRRMA